MELNFSGLRPVELLFLAHKSDEEYFDEMNALIAILAYFFDQRLIEEREVNQVPFLLMTENGEQAILSGRLHQYEVDILNALLDRRPEVMILAVLHDLDVYLKEYFLRKEYLNQKTKRRWLLFKREVITTAKRTKKIMEDLDQLRESFNAVVAKKGLFTHSPISFLAAFPGVIETEQFRDYASSIPGDYPTTLIMSSIRWAEKMFND